MQSRLMRQFRWYALAAVVAASTSIAQAGIIDPPALSVTLQVSGGEETHLYPTATDNQDGTWTFNGYYHNPETWTLDLSVFADPDPVVSANTVVTNNTGATQTYILTVTLPTIAMPGATLISGSIGGAVTDSNASGSATAAAVAGGSIYTAFIDGLPVETLLDDPYSVTATGVPGTGIIGPASFGIPIPDPGPAVATSIGIRLEFTLTAGDSVAITSAFNVIPGPGGLLALGAFGLIGRRRRN